MSGKGKRRSARVLKLEEQKNDDGTTVCLLDPWQIIRNIISGARGKRKRNEETQKLQGEASPSQAVDATNTNNLSRKISTGQIIEYILYTLEMRDTHELFAMPDDIHVSDYAEQVKRSCDFATLRQKNKDGMYNTLDQFENDVYMVFQKAMSINNQDTIPYREAMSQLDQAKQVFLSLKSNQMYSESDLVAWRQKHLDQPNKPAGKEESNNGGSRDPATPTPQRPNVPAKKKGTPEKKEENAKAGNVSADNTRARQRGAKESKTTPVKRARKAAAAAAAAAGTVEFGSAGVEQRRLTYTDEAGQGGRTMTMPVSQDPHATLLYPQPQEHTYQDSLRRFARHAGMKARVAAEFKILECDARARQNPVPAYWNGLAPSAGAGTASLLPHSSYYPPPPPPSAAAPAFQAPPPLGGSAVADVGEQAPPWCNLETDELLKLVVLMGKSAFLERAKQMFGDTRREESSREGHVTRADDDAKVGVTAAAPGQESGASEPAAAFGPFSPPKLVPGRLGFGQFAGSSAQPFRVTPSTSKASGKQTQPFRVTPSTSKASGKQKALE